MPDEKNSTPDRKKRGLPDIGEQDISNETTDASLNGQDDQTPLEPDELVSKRAASEALRNAAQGGSAYIVSTDLEDGGERTGSPGTREQP